MSKVFRETRRVEFAHTDAAQIAHFSSFFLYMEQAEHSFLRSLGTSVVVEDHEGVISWPRVSANCDFKGSVSFEDEVVIEVSIVRLGTKSVSYALRMFHETVLVAEGAMTSVCCRIKDSGPESIEIPAELRSQLQEYVVDSNA